MVFEVYQENTNRHLVLQQRQRIFEKNGEKYLCIRYVFSSDGIYEYHYTGVKVYFYIPISGIYRIETWGARGGGSYFEGSVFQNESPIAISGCNSSIQEYPGTEGNGFARFTLLKSTQKGALKIQCVCYKRHVLWTLFCTLP